MKTVITIATADWAPHLEQAARRLAQVCAFVYCAGWALGAWVHRTSDQLARLWVRLLVPVQPVSFADVTWPDIDPDTIKWHEPIIYRAQAAAVATPANIAPPVWVHISDPMARAVRLVREGKSQRLAASICGVSRTSLQRALKR